MKTYQVSKNELNNHKLYLRILNSKKGITPENISAAISQELARIDTEFYYPAVESVGIVETSLGMLLYFNYSIVIEEWKTGQNVYNRHIARTRPVGLIVGVFCGPIQTDWRKAQSLSLITFKDMDENPSLMKGICATTQSRDAFYRTLQESVGVHPDFTTMQSGRS